jgi:CubicO group peptidase (beta-lactamase class C family)
MKSKKAICIWLSMSISIILINNLVAEGMETSTPEAQGISTMDILAFVEAVEEQVDALHSFMLLRHDKVVAQGWWYPYNPESPHGMASLSKIFITTAIGMVVDEDLLTMNTGHVKKEVDAFWNNEDKTWVAHFLSQPMTHDPGPHFVYNSHGTYMLSAILQKVSGKTLLEYLKPRLFEPLGIKDPTWETDPQGINLGGWGLIVKTEDVAKLGLLYLRKGIWKGKRLLSELWVDQATSLQTSNGSDPHNDWNQGYGYQFWRCRHNIYRGDGAAGQFCIVMPDQDAVLAITAGVSDIQLVMVLVWEHFLPAMKKAPLKADEKAHTALKTKLDNLVLKELEGDRTSEIAKVINGRTYICE